MNTSLYAKLPRALASVTVAAAIFASAGVASAARAGNSYESSYGDDKFAAGFVIGSSASVLDYEEVCASYDEATFCAGQQGPARTACAAVATAGRAIFCGRQGWVMTAKGEASADATLFGKDVNLLDIDAWAQGGTSQLSTHWGVRIKGQEVASFTSGGMLNISRSLSSRSFSKAEQKISILGIPVTVKVEAVGDIGLSGTLRAHSSSVSGGATPRAEVNAIFSVGVSIPYASTGVEGDLLLVKLRTPQTSSLSYKNGRSFEYSTSLELHLDALDGKVKAYVEYFGEREDKTIVSWDGFELDRTANLSTGTLSL